MKLGLTFPGHLEKQRNQLFSKNSRSLGSFQPSDYEFSSKSEGAVYSLGRSLLFVLFFLVFLSLVARLFWLQVVQGSIQRNLSDSNRVFVKANPSLRGVIYDNNGVILARNVPGFKALFDPSKIEDRENEGLKKTEENLARILSLPKDDLEKKIKQSLAFGEVITLKNNLSYDEQLKLESLKAELQGVSVESEMVRAYPFGQLLSPVLGFLAEATSKELDSSLDYHLGSLVGREGLEKAYESYLRGKDGKVFFQADALGKKVNELKREEPQNGSSLYLSLDWELQKKSYEVLQKAIQKYQATGGVFIAQNPSTGKILSLVSLPSFDNNVFSKSSSPEEIAKVLQDKNQPLFNRAIAGLYPPGSTVKPLIGLKALESKIITSSTKIDDFPQVIQIGPFKFPDWTVAWGRGAHGLLNIKEAIAQSCDIFFYKIGGGYEQIKGLGIEKIKEILEDFGLGKATGIDLPGEANGLVPDETWKKNAKNESWYLGDTYQLSIGQSFLLVTPLQIVNYISALANGGRLFKPQLVQKIVDENGKTVKEFLAEPSKTHLAMSGNLETIRQGMRMAVSQGIVYPFRNNKVAVAAKTGTAEFGVSNAKGVYETHAWVTGFAPFDNPQISFVLLLEAGGASSNAAEAGNEIINWYFSRTNQ